MGPSDESADQFSNTGMACHIVAAAEGPAARRVVTAMSQDERSSMANGIWMCYSHGKLIDTDESRFTIEMLKAWRNVAELRARISQELGREVTFGEGVFATLPLVENELTLNGMGGENELIGSTIKACCIHEIWGNRLAHAVRDLVIELARNAFDHGGASTLTFKVETNRLRLLDDGHPFNIWTLPTQDRTGGGTSAIQQLIGDFGDRLVVSSNRRHPGNETVIALIRKTEDVLKVTPCTLVLDHHGFSPSQQNALLLNECDTVYVVLPRFLTLSDAYKIPGRIVNAMPQGKRIVFVVEEVSDWVPKILKEGVPDAGIIMLRDA
jgi:hypothetical protein